MTDDEVKLVLDKLVSVTEFLCNETAGLVNDYSTRVTKEAVAGVRARSEQLRAAGQELRSIYGTSLDRQDS